MRRKLIFTNIVLLLVSLAMCLGVSLYISRRNVLTNAKLNINSYSLAVIDDLKQNKPIDYEKYQIINDKMRITLINKTQTDVFLMSDNYYDGNLDALSNVDWMELKEFTTINDFIIRKDETSTTSKRMLYYTDTIHRPNLEQYIRVGVPYDDLFEDNTSLIVITLITSIIIFVVMSFVMGQSIYQGIKPINKVIGNLEMLATTTMKWSGASMSLKRKSKTLKTKRIKLNLS